MIDISIVIVSWNTREFLLGCLRSIVSGRERVGIEIIVVDNASNDSSPDAVRMEFPEVRLIQNATNLGFAKANNIGIRASTGRYVCLINSDVVVSQGCLDRMCAYLDQHASIGLLGPKILNADLTLQLSCRQFPDLWSSFCRALALDTIFPRYPLLSGSLMRSFSHDEAIQVDVLSGCFWMIRRATVAGVGLLDEDFFMYSEDVDYCKRCWRSGWEIVYSPEVTAVHHGGASSSHFPVRFEVEGLRARLQYWRKHHSRISQAGFAFISLLHQVRKIVQGIVLYIVRSSERERITAEIKASIACSRWLLCGSTPHQNQTS
jgi:GT2 family glycosyltransferase